MSKADWVITITDRSRGEEFSAWFQEQGVPLVLTTLGRGTATTEILDCLGLEDTEKAVRAVIEERMDFEQFAECDITMADLTKIRQALVSAFMGASHHRIQYPSIKYKRTENGTKGENV